MQLLQNQVAAVCHFKVNAKQPSADRIHLKSERTELHIPNFFFHYVAFRLHSQVKTSYKYVFFF